ncbi:MAG: peptidoglycan editing factor PgeF [Ruminococcaceae bacterium]|nr:peptidoglycan editing factor PgeF [Oscillospiraceae bacterium]
MAFRMHEADTLVWLTSQQLEDCKAIRHGFSTRRGGVSPAPWDSLNLAIGRPDGSEAVQENYRRFCCVLGVNPKNVVLPQQTHSINIRRVTAADAGKGLWHQRDYQQVDGLITNEPNLSLVVFSADCGIVLLYDPVHHAAGAVHAGWRGCANGIPEKAVADMQAAFGSDPAQLLAAIGPCIGQCCFETDSDVPEAMRAALGQDAEPYLQWRDPKFHVDLEGLNRQWLLRAGLLSANIDTCGLCTACHPELFWSHRKMGEQRGAQVALISLC